MYLGYLIFYIRDLSICRFMVQGVGGNPGNNPLQIPKDNFLMKIHTFIVLLFVFSFIPSALFICESKPS